MVVAIPGAEVCRSSARFFQVQVACLCRQRRVVLLHESLEAERRTCQR